MKWWIIFMVKVKQSNEHSLSLLKASNEIVVIIYNTANDYGCKSVCSLKDLFHFSAFLW